MKEKAMLGKILAEIMRSQKYAGMDASYGEYSYDKVIHGLLNGHEHIIDEVFSRCCDKDGNPKLSLDKCIKAECVLKNAELQKMDGWQLRNAFVAEGLEIEEQLSFLREMYYDKCYKDVIDRAIKDGPTEYNHLNKLDE